MGCAPCFCYRTGISSAGSNVSVRAEWTIVCACLASASASQSCRRCRACLGRFAVANRVDGDAAAIACERVRSDGRSRLRRSRRTTAGLRPVDAPLGTNGHKPVLRPRSDHPPPPSRPRICSANTVRAGLGGTSNLPRASLEVPYSLGRSHRSRIKTGIFAGAFSGGANRDRTGDLLLAKQATLADLPYFYGFLEPISDKRSPQISRLGNTLGNTLDPWLIVCVRDERGGGDAKRTPADAR